MIIGDLCLSILPTLCFTTISEQFIKEGRTLPSRKNKDFYERMAIKFGYKNPQSIYRIVLGCTNRFFGENIVQTTNRSGNENCSGKR